MRELIRQEAAKFEEAFKLYISSNIDDYIREFIFRKSKRLRPLLGILFLKTLSIEPEKEHEKLFFAIELIHNASLIHDDIIDKAKDRRGKPSLNEKYDNSLAVVTGDLLLAFGMKSIINIKDTDVQKLCIDNMIQTCFGEINQYFSKYKIPTLDEYIQKSKQKTAMLFKIAVLGAAMISGKKAYYQTASDFSENFGIAFQIKNDLENYKGKWDDREQGIYTALDIFDDKNSVEKTKNLINNYLDKAISSLDNMPKNQYLQALEHIVNEMRER